MSQETKPITVSPDTLNLIVHDRTTDRYLRLIRIVTDNAGDQGLYFQHLNPTTSYHVTLRDQFVTASDFMDRSRCAVLNAVVLKDGNVFSCILVPLKMEDAKKILTFPPEEISALFKPNVCFVDDRGFGWRPVAEIETDEIVPLKRKSRSGFGYKEVDRLELLTTHALHPLGFGDNSGV